MIPLISVPLRWGGKDAFTHMLVVGPTRCGKTATLLKPLIYQILLAKKRATPVGLSVVEPKGDVVSMVKEMCDAMEIPLFCLDPRYPLQTDRLNVMNGDTNSVSEATVAVLKSLFGRQEAFFAIVQELSTRNITKLLKELYQDSMDITDVLDNLRDEKKLKQNVALLESRQGESDLVKFFKEELLGDGDLAKKYKQLVIGLRAQLENLTSNDNLKSIITGKSSINLDAHFAEGGVLAVNTALGLLGPAGDAFGQFIAMHLQLATFRRPGTEETRVPHYLIVDEYSRYMNPDVERFLSIAAEYRVAGIFALQSLGQLEVETGKLSAKAVKQAILASCRNKIAFGGLSAADAKEFADEFGKEIVTERMETFEGGILPSLFPTSYREVDQEKHRFSPTFLMDGMPAFHFVHKLLKDGHPQPPGMGRGLFVPRDWKEQLITQPNIFVDFRTLPSAAFRAVRNLFQFRKIESVEQHNQRMFKEWLEEQKYSQVINKKSVETVDKVTLKGGEDSKNAAKMEQRSKTGEQQAQKDEPVGLHHQNNAEKLNNLDPHEGSNPNPSQASTWSSNSSFWGDDTSKP
ncbi:type IV secretory system conjugative DNA transfer family protein [Brevibacillus dissolubilis]|uniref:type IV secretory system conjugative DNA transfer family protein n=1 Tax=Brevibacillus dissolubilis TaxID=1844116 RepID=UPI00210062DE|nr:TraM recognition domain-containing protein [Brevibacillus dissolubilis]